MTVKQIYEELKQHDPEWIRQFIELVKLFKEAAPEHRKNVIEMLKGKQNESRY